MVSTSTDNRILVRRASEHISGRLSYRQVRHYTVHHLEDSSSMGALKSINNIDIHYQFADFSVETPGYWKLRAYNDFDNGDLVTINGVPTRKYHHKQILKLDFSKFGDAFSDSVRMTLTNLLNEVFVTLFAENQPFISAVTLGSYDAPLTYSLNFEDAIENTEKCIYIIEDSQLDIGLLIAVERNANRILQIIADYLSWNDEQIAESIRKQNAPAEETALGSLEAYAEAAQPEKKKGFFRRVGDWFKNLFKKKKDKQPPEQDYMMIYGKPHKLVDGKWVPCSQEEFNERMQKRHELLEEASENTEEAAENDIEGASAEQNVESAIQDDPETSLSPKEARKAEKAAAKAEKKAAREQKKAQKQEEKLRKKQEKIAKKEASKAARKAAKEPAEEVPQPEEASSETPMDTSEQRQMEDEVNEDA
ncbi:MAG: hypothetical protein IJD10_05875 [Clostridia bacterium]|nr:hypothetical protein [Clostridia bacterium]